MTLKALLILGLTVLLFSCASSQKFPPPEAWLDADKVWNPGVDSPIASTTPSLGQQKQIDRKYGMFIHYGINTFNNQEWTDGSKPVSSYDPTVIDAKQWVETAKNAGMKYIILVAKHHEGFALWDSPLTDYDVGSAKLKTDVVAAVAEECEKQGIELGLYYSLWDRKVNGDVRNFEADAAYNEYMLKQIEDLMTNYGDICELWLDGGWEKEYWRWPIREIYTMVKKYQPDCQVAVNWTIGSPDDMERLVYPADQEEGYPMRFFPSDFRLGDPMLPKDDDPKLFTHNGKSYYLPWESTLCLSGRWFYHTEDDTLRPVEELVEIFKQATKNDNVLIVNVAPNRESQVRESHAARLVELREALVEEGLLD